MALDPKRLVRDAKRAQADRPGSAIGRETTGVTRAVRESLGVIRSLRAAGVTWNAIAQAMTGQGITQSGGRLLTATRLTAIVGEVEAQMRRTAQHLAQRARRRDLAPGADEGGPDPAFIAASSRPRAEVVPAGSTDSPLPLALREHPATEAEIRRAGLATLKRILSKE